MTLIANRFTPLHPLSPYLMLVRDQDGTPRVLKRLSEADARDPQAVLRLRLEAWRASELEGPRFARAFGDDEPDAGAPYYTMGYAQGPAATLVTPTELPEVLRHLAAALVELHKRGWVHAGLEPAHLRRTEGGLVVVGYGTMTAIGQRATRSGHADFQAPEQRAGEPLDGRADLYSVGALLHYWLTNRPYNGQDRLEGVDSPYVPLARKLLAERPEDRLPDAATLLAQLGLPLEASPPVWVSPLVYRPGAIAPIESLLAELANGTGGSRRLEAPAGMGKTRLLDLAAEAAARAEWPVARAKGEGALSAPLAPWRSLIEALLKLAAERQNGLAERFRSRLAGWDVSASSGLDPESARLRWLTTLAELLAAVAPPGLVILLDDWDQADEASARAQEFLRRRLLDAPIVWLLAGERLPSRAPAIPVPPFSRDEAFGLAAGLLAGPMGGPEVEKLVGYANGAPWCLKHLIAHLRESNLLVRDVYGWKLRLPGDPPKGAEALAWARAHALPTAAWSVGGMAALLRPLVRAEELLKLVDDPGILAEGLDALLRAGVLDQDAAGYRFTHPAFADILGQAVTQDRQAALRTTLVADLDADALAPGEAVRWVGMAIEADRPDLAARLALSAGRQALAAGGVAEARQLLEEGMITLDTEHPDRGRYLMALAETFRVEGEAAEAKTLLEEAARILAPGAERLEALLALGRLALRQGQAAEARSRFREAVGHAQTHGGTDAMAFALSGLTESLTALGEADEAAVSGEAALGAAAEASALPRAAALTALGAVLATGGRDRQPEGVALLQRATALYEAEGDQLGLVTALLRLADAELARGELRIARDTAERALQLATDLDDARAAARAAITLSAASRELGQAVSGADLARKARDRAVEVADPSLQAEALLHEALAKQALGEAEAASTLIADAQALLTPDCTPVLRAFGALAAAEMALAQHKLPEAAGALAQAEAPVAAAQRPELAGRRAYWLGRWAARTGDRERARQELKAVLAQPNQYWVARSALALGELAAEAGAQAEAAGWLEQARRGAVTLGVDWLATAAAEAEKALAVGPTAAESFESAAARLQALFKEAQHLLPKMVEPAEELEALRRRLAVAEAMKTLWRRFFDVETEAEVAATVAEAIFGATGAARVFILGRSLEPLVARSREAGDLLYSPSLVRLDLCRTAAEQGRTVHAEPGVGAIARPVTDGRKTRWVLYLVGVAEEPETLGAIVDAAELALSRLEG